MRTIRVRLAVWYAVALAVTMFAFAAVIYITQRHDAYVALDRHARAESDLIASNLAEAYRGRGALVVTNPETGQPPAQFPNGPGAKQGCRGKRKCR